MDKERFLSDLSTIDNQLSLFTYDEYDRDLCREIKKNLFVLVKVSGSFDEYLDQINELTFKPTSIIYSEPHHMVRQHFDGTKERLLDIIDTIKREVSFGKLDDVTLEKPDTITFPWLWKNISARNLVWFSGALLFLATSAFALGSYF